VGSEACEVEMNQPLKYDSQGLMRTGALVSSANNASLGRFKVDTGIETICGAPAAGADKKQPPNLDFGALCGWLWQRIKGQA